ncbi:corrinoid protein [Moorellaceae bacterium AZ2]
MLEKLVEHIANLEEEQAMSTAKQLLEQGIDPMKILECCRQATDIVGKCFEEGRYFIPDLMLSGEIIKEISELVKPRIGAVEIARAGKVVIGTVEGDLHDIGKNIVIFLLEVNGFEVFDLGIDVPPMKFVEKIREVKPDIVGLSALLTVAFDSMKRTIEAIKQAGLREGVKIVIGGAPTSEAVAHYVGADAWARDAQHGVQLAKQWIAAKYES